MYYSVYSTESKGSIFVDICRAVKVKKYLKIHEKYALKYNNEVNVLYNIPPLLTLVIVWFQTRVHAFADITASTLMSWLLDFGHRSISEVGAADVGR